MGTDTLLWRKNEGTLKEKWRWRRIEGSWNEVWRRFEGRMNKNSTLWYCNDNLFSFNEWMNKWMRSLSTRGKLNRAGVNSHWLEWIIILVLIQHQDQHKQLCSLLYSNCITNSAKHTCILYNTTTTTKEHNRDLTNISVIPQLIYQI